MDTLCAPLYRAQSSGDVVERYRARLVLFHVYHHAIHNRWYVARDLMLMSRLQESMRSLATTKDANPFNTVTMVNSRNRAGSKLSSRHGVPSHRFGHVILSFLFFVFLDLV
jgi:hypothetical protein